MPRPIFGQADWWTFEELDDVARFVAANPHEDGGDTFQTKAAIDADRLAEEAFGADMSDGAREYGVPTWPGLEFCVSRGTRTVLMVRRRETGRCPLLPIQGSE